MDDKLKRLKNFPSADEDASSSTICPQTPQTLSDSYKLSDMDPHFMMRTNSFKLIRQTSTLSRGSR